MECWYCYWGWAKEVADIYEKYEALLDGLGYCGSMELEYGRAHVVWGEENWETNHIDFCLNECDDAIALISGHEFDGYGQSVEAVELVKQSLLELKAIPEATRCCEPAGYDGKHPEKYPPAIAVRVAGARE
jgi:hypothetical protein